MSTDAVLGRTPTSAKVKKPKHKDPSEKSSSKKQKHLPQDESPSARNNESSPAKDKKKRKHTESNGTYETFDQSGEPVKKKKKRHSHIGEVGSDEANGSIPPSILNSRSEQGTSEAGTEKKKKKRQQQSDTPRLSPARTTVDPTVSPEQDARAERKKEKRREKRRSNTEDQTRLNGINGELPESASPLLQQRSHGDLPESIEKSLEDKRKEKKKKRKSTLKENVIAQDHTHGQSDQNTSLLPSSTPVQPTPRIESLGSKQITELQRQSQISTQKSPFVIVTTSMYLPLPPIGLPKPLESLCADHLSSNILTYFEPVKGVLLAYRNARLSQSRSTGTSAALAMTHAEYGNPYTWLTADFTVFKPERGTWLEGHVSVQNSGYLGLVCYNLFNASIVKDRIPKNWDWRSGNTATSEYEAAESWGNAEGQDITPTAEGSWVDEKGKRVEGLLKFRVRDFESLPGGYGREKGFIAIEGTLVNEDEEEEIERRIRTGKDGSQSTSQSTSQGSASGKKLKGLLKRRSKDAVNPYGTMSDANI